MYVVWVRRVSCISWIGAVAVIVIGPPIVGLWSRIEMRIASNDRWDWEYSQADIETCCWFLGGFALTITAALIALTEREAARLCLRSG